MAKQNVAGDGTRAPREKRTAQTMLTIPGQAPQQWQTSPNTRIAIGNVLHRLNDPIGLGKGVRFEVQRETAPKSGKFVEYFAATVTSASTSAAGIRKMGVEIEFAI